MSDANEPIQASPALPLSRNDVIRLAIIKACEKHDISIPYAYATLSLVSDLCGIGDNCVWPGHPKVAELFGVNRTTVGRQMSALHDAGLIAIRGRVVKLTLPVPDQCEADAYRRLLATKDVDATGAGPMPTKSPEETPRPAKSLGPRKRRAEAKLDGQEVVRKQEAMTEEEKVLACSSVEMMSRYLMFGTAGLRETDDSKLKPTSMNWRTADAPNPDAPNPSSWTVAQFVGYYWFLSQHWNAAAQQPLALPPKTGIGRMMKTIADTLSTMTQWQLLRRLQTLYTHFGLIKMELRGLTVVFNETALWDTNVQKKLVDIEGCDLITLEQRYEKAGLPFNNVK